MCDSALILGIKIRKPPPIIQHPDKTQSIYRLVQMEGSWLEKPTTANSAKRLAEKVSNELKVLAK